MKGKGFNSDVNPGEFNCRFTGTQGENFIEKIIPAKFESESEIVCNIPGGWEDVDDIEFAISFNGIDYTTLDNKISLYKVSGISPTSAPEGGSTQGITIYGSGFKTDTNATLYINHEPQKPTSITENEITFKPFVGTGIGSLPMEATVNGVDFIKYKDGFAVYKQPVIMTMDPTYGPTSG